MDPTTLDQITNLGVAGFAILVMWWMSQSSSERLDRAYEDYKALEKEVRTTITAQLAASTSALYENSKLMERVIDKISKI